MATKKLNPKTVKAVGGCQHDALVALLKEMGYEIENAGARVRVGQRIRLVSTPYLSQYKAGDEFTVAPKLNHNLHAMERIVNIYDANGRVLAVQSEEYQTMDGKKVLGYEE